MNTNLFNQSSRFLDRFFRRVDGLVWDLSTGRLGIQGNDGIITLEVNAAVPAGEGQEAQPASYNISVNPFDGFGLPIPAFAANTPHDQIEVGDLIVGASKVLGWVIEKKPASLVLLSQDGMQKQYNPPKVQVFGQDGSLVVKSLTGLLGDGTQGFQSSLMPLLLLGGDTGLDMDKLIPLMLFQQGNGAGANGMASMLPMLMLLGNGGLGGRALQNAPLGGNVGFGSTGAPPLQIGPRRTR